MGIQGKSKPQKQFVIFSFDASLLADFGSVDNITPAARRSRFKRYVAPYCQGDVQHLIGSYKGIKEGSFLVSRADYEVIKCIWDSPVMQEETVLLLGGRAADARSRPSADLYTPDLTSLTQKLGFMGSIDESEVEIFDCWSKTNGRYWVAQPLNDWHTYETIKRAGRDITSFEGDWRTVKPVLLTDTERAFLASIDD